MSYTSERTPGIQCVEIPQYLIEELISELPGNASGVNSTGLFNSNNKMTINGTTVLIKNIVSRRPIYNLFDVIAICKTANYTDAQINTALESVVTSLKNDIDSSPNHQIDLSSKEFYKGYVSLKNSADDANMSVAAYINTYTLPGLGDLVKEINTKYSNANAHIDTTLDEDGVTYTYTLKYTNPIDRKEYATVINPDEVGIQNDGSIDEANKNAFIAPISEVFEKHQMLDENTNANIEAALKSDAALTALGNFANAPTNKDISQEELDFIRNSAPTTDNLKAYNKLREYNIYDSILKDFKFDNDGSGRFKAASREAIRGLADIIDAEKQGVTLRNINNEQAKLLDQIRKDPELYQAITQQLRSDSVAGTIAGQRAANVGAVAKETDATYDEAAANLYSSLFSGDGGSIANATRESVAGNKASALETFITGKLGEAAADVAAGEKSSKDLQTLINGASNALDIDYITQKDAATVAETMIKGYVADQIRDATDEARAKGESMELAIKQIAERYGLTTDMLKDATNNNMTIDSVIGVLTESIAGNLLSYDYTRAPSYNTSKTPEYKFSEKDPNFEYESFLDPEKNPLWSILADPSTFTETMSEKDFANKYGLDFIDAAGMQAEYEAIAKEANKESNQVFNKAQRAYIAAITAGDAKTAEQLTRLATSVGGTKGNLYAASALANQFKQQDNASVTGRQLATDFQNQQSANLEAISRYGMEGYNKSNQFYAGTGNSSENTFSNIFSRYENTQAANRAWLSELGNKGALSTAHMNSLMTDLDNIKYLEGQNLAHGYTDANRLGTQYNNANTATGQFTQLQIQADLKKNEEQRKANGLAPAPAAAAYNTSRRN